MSDLQIAVDDLRAAHAAQLASVQAVTAAHAAQIVALQEVIATGGTETAGLRLTVTKQDAVIRALENALAARTRETEALRQENVSLRSVASDLRERATGADARSARIEQLVRDTLPRR